MFEVIISRVRTGHVKRWLFDTREEADRFAEETLEAWMNPKWVGDKRPKPRSARGLRIEIQYRDLPAIHRLTQATHSHTAVA